MVDNPCTTISFALAEEAQVKIDVYDIRGRKVRELLNELSNPGKFNLTWNADTQTSGVYYIRSHAGCVILYEKVNLLK
ncbi:MAG: T9SS type A sorting domain-containing protein [Candidatus Cloacimonetes bacterium]|nr:T9SS type A sorting domain-containing protein [Candidatus Cloacimonadota bacterium]